MTGKRSKDFEKERRRQAKRLTAIQRDTDAEVARLLKSAGDEITVGLASEPGGFDAFILPRIQQSIRAALAEAGDGMAKAAGAGAEAAWTAGIDLVDKPLEAAGVRIAAALAVVDRTQLMAMRTFMTGRLKDVTLEAANRINNELALAMIGVQTPHEATGKVARILTAGGRARAQRITRTEIGRAFSVASQERLNQAAGHLPGMRKMWRRSGKIHSRVSHDVADGQVRKPGEPFTVGAEDLMFPRDPKGSAGNTVNCGCVSLPHMADWEVRHPGARLITGDEMAKSEAKRRVAGVQAAAFDGWTRKLSARSIDAAGHFETAGGLTPGLKEALRARGVEPATGEIAVTDRKILHMLRDAKKRKGLALPAGEVRRLPEHLAAPKAVLWEIGAEPPTLIYVFDIERPDEDRLGKFPVKIRGRDKAASHRRHNWVASGGLVKRSTLDDTQRYEVLVGAV